MKKVNETKIKIALTMVIIFITPIKADLKSPDKLRASVKADKEIKKDLNSETNYDHYMGKIISTKGACEASCCANNNLKNKKEDFNAKSKKQKSKKKFRWFSRTK